MIQNVYNGEIDKTDEKVINLPKGWNKSKREGEGGREKITK